MKKVYGLVFSLILLSIVAVAQDEGAVVVKQRFERDNTVYFSLGPSITLGKNLGDYSAGFNVEAGYLKRMNKILSIGPNISYLNFGYDATKTYPYYYDPETDQAISLQFTGGDISILSLGVNLKVSFIPVSDHTKFSIYGVANPFISIASKSAITGDVAFYGNDGFANYDVLLLSTTFTSEDVDGFGKESNVSGGLHAGFGFEFMPAKKISFFGQATFSYTLPISYVATRDFSKDAQVYYDASDNAYYDTNGSIYDEGFPIVKKGFGALSIKLGVAYNF